MMYVYGWAPVHHRSTPPWSSALISLARVGVPVEVLWAILWKLAGAEAIVERVQMVRPR